MSSKNKRSKHVYEKSHHNPNNPPPRLGTWEQMVMNPSAHVPVRTPSLGPYTGGVRTFTRTFAIDSQGADDRFSFVLRPSLADSFRIVRQTGLTLPNGGQAANVGMGIENNYTYQDSPALSGELLLYGSGGVIKGAIRNSWDPVDDVPYYALRIEDQDEVKVAVSGHYHSFQVYKLVAGSWQLDGSESGIGKSVATVGVQAGGSGIDGILVTVNGAFRDGLGLSISQDVGNPTFADPSSYDLFETDAVTIGRVSSYRVTAASILATFSGNMLENGGVIAAARTRAGYWYDEDDPYKALTKLQDHVYRGATREGAYVWWLPYDFDELDPRGVHDRKDLTELHVAGTFDSVGASLQVTVTMTVEFYSPLQIFEHVPGPALTDEFVQGYHALDGAPAATCNPAHTKVLKNALKKGKKTAVGAKDFLMEHPELLTILTAGL